MQSQQIRKMFTFLSIDGNSAIRPRLAIKTDKAINEDDPISNQYNYLFFLKIIPFTSWMFSYQILCPKAIKDVADPKKVAAIILESTDLPEDNYRLGNTKARLHTITYLNNLFVFICKWNEEGKLFKIF